MTGEDWIHEAMCDDSLVAEALICLLHAEPQTKSGGASDLKLKWTVRQRRTKAASLRKKGDENTRASPTTPLSWSGATSFSGGGGGGGAVDGLEESSGAVKLSEAVRSKVRSIISLWFLCSTVFKTSALLCIYPLGCGVLTATCHRVILKPSRFFFFFAISNFTSSQSSSLFSATTATFAPICFS